MPRENWTETSPLTKYVYYYTLSDHLGNARLVMNDDQDAEVVQSNSYSAFGLLALGPDVLAGKFNNRFYNGKEKQEGTGWYDYGARMYYSELGRWMTIDRFSEKYYSHSSYHYTLNNPISNIDINGDSTYRFDSNTNAYIGLFDTDQSGQVGSYGTMQTIGKGKKKQEVWNGEYFDFADPVNDSKQIREGQINHLEIISDNEIQSLMREQGAFETGMVNFGWQSQGGKKFDYAFTILKDKYPDSKFDGEKSNTLFLPKGENTAHNFGNFGNYLWGATGYTAGFGYTELSAGAHFNSVANPGRNGYPSQWDSKDDQNSIKKGIYHAQKFKYRNLTR